MEEHRQSVKVLILELLVSVYSINGILTITSSRDYLTPLQPVNITCASTERALNDVFTFQVNNIVHSTILTSNCFIAAAGEQTECQSNVCACEPDMKSVIWVYNDNIEYTSIMNFTCEITLIRTPPIPERATLQLRKADKPEKIAVFPSTPSNTVTETTGSVGPITCTAECRPDCTYQWTGPNGPVGTTSVLNLQNINRNQAGDYKCTASNTVGSLMSEAINVIVNYGPAQVFIFPLTLSYTVAEITGSVGPISCTADCKPDCTYRWTGPNGLAGTTSELILQNIDRNQAGNYQCTANNSIRTMRSTTISINILYGPRKVNLLPPNTSYIVTETTGNIGPINCTADCKPACSMTWAGPSLPSGSTSVLYIRRINRSQAGNYTCNAANNIKTETSETLQIIVHYKTSVSGIVTSEHLSFGTGIGAGVGMIVFVAVVFISIFLLLRRSRKSPSSDKAVYDSTQPNISQGNPYNELGEIIRDNSEQDARNQYEDLETLTKRTSADQKFNDNSQTKGSDEAINRNMREQDKKYDNL